MNTRAIAIIIILLILFGSVIYVVEAYKSVERLEVEIYDLSTKGLVLKVTNPTRYIYELKEIKIILYINDKPVVEGESQEVITVKPGESEYITVNVNVNIASIIEAILNWRQSQIETTILVSPKIGPITLPSYEIKSK